MKDEPQNVYDFFRVASEVQQETRREIKERVFKRLHQKMVTAANSGAFKLELAGSKGSYTAEDIRYILNDDYCMKRLEDSGFKLKYGTHRTQYDGEQVYFTVYWNNV